MNRRFEKLLGLLVLLCSATALVTYALWFYTRIPSIPALFPYLFVSAVVCLILYTRFRLNRLEETEVRDQMALEHSAASEPLFLRNIDASDTLPSGHVRRQFERWVAPLAAPGLALLLVYWGYRISQSETGLLTDPVHRLFASSVLLGQAFIFFLFGRYFLGLSRSPDYRLLRGSGNYLLLIALLSAFTALASLIAESGYPIVESFLRTGLAFYAWVLAAEFVLNTVGHLYTPKNARDLVVTYESRITALVTDPHSWASSIAQALDYQFGFKVSETIFFRFTQRALLPLLLVQVLLLFAFSSLVMLDPEELAIKERFGNPLGPDGTPSLLSSGIHLKWPWPIETVRRYPAQRIASLDIGYSRDPENPHPTLMLWTQPHYMGEDQFIVAQRAEPTEHDEEGVDLAVPVNFIVANLAVKYRVTDLYQYLYVHRYPDELLRAVAERELTRQLAGRDFIELLGRERLETRSLLTANLQQQADQLELGLEILFIGLSGARPPIPVAPAFESVIGSLEERQTAVIQARAYHNRVLPMVRAEAAEYIWLARSDAVRRVSSAEVEADWFNTRLQLHEKLPSLYTSRLYLETLQRVLQPVRKYVVATSPDLEVLIIDPEKISPSGLFDFGAGRLEDPFL